MAQAQETQALWTPLLVEVGQGSRAALKRLYVLSSPRLYAIVRRVQSDRAEAEDVLQEVYIRIWMHAGSFDADRACAAAWLHGIAQHAALDNLRRARCRPRLRGTIDGEAGDPCDKIPCPAPAPPERLQAQQSAQAVRSSLQHLPTDAREVVMLAYDRGLSHSETALLLGRPLGSVKSLLRRSLQALRPALAAYR
jgi:RNA polymerase sigma factor (sigma-70 family)